MKAYTPSAYNDAHISQGWVLSPFIHYHCNSQKYIWFMSQHSCHINPNGKLKCWGNNSHGRLGLGDTTTRGDNANEMGDNLSLVDLGIESKVKQIAMGGEHTCVILINDKMKCWGNNQYGQTGMDENK